MIKKLYSKYVQEYFKPYRVRLGNLAPAIELHEAVTLEQLNEIKTSMDNLGDAKDSVRVAANTNVPLSGLQTIQGITLEEGDRVALINQTNSYENGIWIASDGEWKRSPDADTSEKVTTFMYFGVEDGDEKGKIYYLSTTGEIELDVTGLQFKEFGGSLDLIPNRAITRDFNTIQGYVITSDNIKDAWEEVFYPAVAPDLSLAVVGATIREMGANPNVNLNYSVTKRTYGIVSITIESTSIAVNPNISEDSSINGTVQVGSQPVTSTPNVMTTWTMTVITTKGTSSSKTATLNWSVAKFWGRIGVDGNGTPTTNINDMVNSPITDAQILSLNGASSGTGKALSNNLIGSYNGINGQGEFLVFICRTGTTPVFKINGLISTAYTKIRSNSPFVNSNGYTYNVDVWCGNTVQNSPIASFIIE